MADVFLLEIEHPKVPRQRILIEAAGAATAKRAYADLVAKVRKVDAGEALKLHGEGVPLLSGPTVEGDEASPS